MDIASINVTYADSLDSGDARVATFVKPDPAAQNLTPSMTTEFSGDYMIVKQFDGAVTTVTITPLKFIKTLTY